jgi:S1-C subfamily serine protease
MHNAMVLLLAALTLAATPIAEGQTVDSPRVTPLVKLKRQVLPAVVAVRTLRPGKQQGVLDINHGGGSVIHPAGYILTNAHVIAGSNHIEVAFFQGVWQRVRLIAELPQEDLALLKLDGDKPLATLLLGRSADLELGEPVITIGSPGGLPHSLSTGIISGLGRSTNTEFAHLPDMVQTTASISGGSSGGPLINALGEQIGVITSRKSDGEGLGFAITVDRIRLILPQLLAIEQRFGITHGLTIDTVGPVAKITAIAPDSPAAIAGLQVDDQLLSINTQSLAHGGEYYLSLIDRKPGERLSCVVKRGETEIASELTLGATPRLEPVAVENAQPGLRAARYEGEWQQLPDFTQLKPVEETIQTASPHVAETPSEVGPENFGWVFSGFVKIPADGVYNFTTISDDGSRLTIGDQTIVSNDGLHAASSASGLIRLKPGLYPLRVEYFEATGGQVLRVAVSGPGVPQRELPPEWLFHSP